MNRNWTFCKIVDLMARGAVELKTGPFGTQLHASEYTDSGTPVINVRNIGFGDVREDNLEFIPEATVQRLRGHLLEAGDIVFGRKGAVERHAFIRHKHIGWFQGSDCLRLRIKSPLIVPRFLSYYFQTELHKQWMIKQCSHGSTMASLNQDIISRISFPLPSPQIQRKIAAILSAYDELIENNTRRIAILEEIAQAIYQEWFVHFRYPGYEKNKMVDSELGMIPGEWSVKALRDFGLTVTGKTPSKLIGEYFNEKHMPFIKTPDLHGNMFCVQTTEHLSERGALSQEHKTLPPNSICVSCIGTPGIVSITMSHAQTNQQINSIILADQQNREFLYFALRSLKETISLYGSNGATMINLNKGKFESLEIIYPEKGILLEFHKKTYSLFEQIKRLQLINVNLCRTRDILLPKLISGEISVEALDIDISEVIEPEAQQTIPTVIQPELIDATQLALPLS